MEQQLTHQENVPFEQKSESEESFLQYLSDEEETSSPRSEKNVSVAKPQKTNVDSKQIIQLPNTETKATDKIQSPKQKSNSGEIKSRKTTKTQSNPQSLKKQRRKKEFTEESKGPQNQKNQRQSNPEIAKSPETKQKTINSSIKEKNIEHDMQWTVNNVESDGQDNRQSKEEQQNNENFKKTAILEEEDIENLTSRYNSDELNLGMIQMQMTLKYEHWVENKHLLVLYLLFRHEIYSQFSKKQTHRIDIHPSNKNKIRIYGSTQEQLKEISSKISQLIQKIAIVKLNIRIEQATKLKSSKLLNDRLLKDNMVIFRYGNNGEKSYYLGGKGTQSQLSTFFKDIRNLKFRYFRMFDYKNTRSYNIMLGHFVRQKELLKAFSKWGIKNLEPVPYIPNLNHHGSKKDKEKSLCFLMTTSGNTENFSPKDIQMSMTAFVKEKFYSIVFIFKKGDKYLPKLSVETVYFKYVYEKKFSWAYVYIMCLKKDFFLKRDDIIKEIEKLTQINLIFGVRYFDNISPDRSNYSKPEVYKEVPFPEQSPYSSSILARKIGCDEGEKKKEGKHQDKSKDEKKEDQEERKEEKDDKKNEQEKMREKEVRGWHSFDWKEHLMSIKDEVKP